jgi:hypothetical protein
MYLDTISREKFIRLVGIERYDWETDGVTITADRCPYRKQNREYCEYLLKALYYESRKREEWELLIQDVDKFDYEPKAEEKEDLPMKLATAKILNQGENVKTLSDYKKAALEKFNLKNDIPLSSAN